MKFCERHWSALRKAIDDRGIGNLVARDGVVAISSWQTEAELDTRAIANYDPLMSAHWAIVNNVGKSVSGGVSAVLFADDCPLCLLTRLHAEGCDDPTCEVHDFDMWIDKAADEQLQRVNEMRAGA